MTGCLGFIGSYITRKCLERGWRVYGVDKCTYVANENNLLEFAAHDNFTFEKIDICDMTHLYDCDYVVNFAAESHVDNSIVNSEEFICAADSWGSGIVRYSLHQFCRSVVAARRSEHGSSGWSERDD